ncbi:cilia- and flagella-associated protein [Salix suchowensis]|nr:cilia- and flagella-associated protein [Salix suchowensis]
MNSTRGTHYTASSRRAGETPLSPVAGSMGHPSNLFFSIGGSGGVGAGQKGGGVCGIGGGNAVSARKLAAGLWRMRLAGAGAGGGGGGDKGLNLRKGKSDELGLEIESPPLYSKHNMEGATKWDPRCPGISSDIFCFYSHPILLESEVALVPAFAMQAELCQSSKKKIKHLLKKLGEERTSSQCSEPQKFMKLLVILTINYARKNKTSKQFKKDYNEQKRARKIMEKVCNELADKVAENKAKVETFKIESIKIQEEMEEERRMLQMAEVWREERVQMKLIDAKLVLEDKYCQMNKLITDLEILLTSRIANLDVMELRTAHSTRQAAKLVDVKDIKEFSYTPPKSSDMYSIYQELKHIEANEREIEECNKSSPASNASKLQLASSDFNEHNYHSLQQGLTIIIDDNCHLEEDARGHQAVNHAEDQGSSYSHDENHLSVYKLRQSKNDSQIAREYTQSSEVYSVPEESMCKASSISKLSISGQYNKCSEITADDSDGMVLSGIISDKETYPRRKSWEYRLRHQDSVEQWSSPEWVNPPVTHGIKERIKRPRATQNNSLKAKLLEARMESQKTQLRGALKQKTWKKYILNLVFVLTVPTQQCGLCTKANAGVLWRIL